MRKIFAILILALCHVVFAFPIKSIKFATEATYPPFESIDKTGKIVGFDIDIAMALCQQIGAQCSFTNQPFSSLLPSLRIGKFDAIISALGITAERKTQVSFTNPYYEPSAVFIALLERKYKSIDDLSGKTIGVQQATTMEKYLQGKYANRVTVKTYASIQDAFMDLTSGRVDAVLADTPIASDWLKLGGNKKLAGPVGKPIIDHEYFGEGYGIAVHLNNNDLLNAFNNALNTIKANGTYDAIKNQYFPD